MRIAYLDIETSPILAAIWPPLHETNAVWVERGTYIYGFAAIWPGEKKVRTHFLPDYPNFKKDVHDDKGLCGDLHKLLSSCDVAVAHNGDRFDLKVIRSRLFLNSFSPPPPIKTVDTLKILRNVFRMDSNKLDNFCRAAGIGGKRPNTGVDLWRGCYHGDKNAFREMARYCARDVRLLRDAHVMLRGWAPNHVDLRHFARPQVACPSCLSTNFQMRGERVSRTQTYRSLQCQDCGKWFMGEKIK